MADDNYDEFGNYIGPELAPSEDEAEASEAPQQQQRPSPPTRMDEEEDEEAAAAAAEPTMAVVLHEDKKYYPGAGEVYPGAETRVEEEDAQPLETPLVAPLRAKRVTVADEAREASDAFLAGLLLTQPHHSRAVALAGHLHHGKTSLVDMLARQQAVSRFSDARRDEQQRGLSVKATPVALALADSRGKHHALTLLDAPGHPCFGDEATAAARLCDGVALVVDVVEGAVLSTERALRAAVRERLPLVLVLSKVDRLALELRLPPQDAYHKLRFVLEQLNALLAAAGSRQRFAPDRGNVVFASAEHGWCFTLETFAAVYASRFAAKGQAAQKKKKKKGLAVQPDPEREAAEGFSAERFARKLWGDQYFHQSTRTFQRSPPPQGAGSGKRSFVEFVLEPLYKVYSLVLGEDPEKVAKVLARELGVRMRPAELRLDVSPMLRIAFSRFLGNAGGLVDAITRNIPSPTAAAPERARSLFAGPLAGNPLGESLSSCDPSGPLLVHVTKLFSREDGTRFDALGRVESGTLYAGERVLVLGEAFAPGVDEEDSAPAVAEKVWLPVGRYRIPVESAPAGTIVLISGVDEIITKTATIVGENALQEGLAIPYRPLAFDTRAVIKVAVEPLNPSDLPKMLEGLRRVGKSYPLCTTRREESGEHTVFGTGELYLDCALRDLRETYGDVEVKVSDPVVSFCETVAETSSVRCFAKTPNAKNRLTVIADPLEPGIAEDAESGLFVASGVEGTTERLRSKYGWDLLAVRSLWAFGPDPERGTNALLDDTLPDEADKELLNSVQRYVVQGFQWGVREGPLCEEPVRGVKFRILGADISEDELQRGGVQIIPTARRVCYSAFLTAAPRLMEPILLCEIYTPQDCVSAIYTLISRRRGQIAGETKCAGTPLQILRSFVPAIDSFGFETDIRTHTQGQAFCLQVFDHWGVVPGDPLDTSVVLRPLEPAPTLALAREFMIKTRRRKGLSEDVSPAKFFDEELRAAMEQEAEAAAEMSVDQQAMMP